MTRVAAKHAATASERGTAASARQLGHEIYDVTDPAKPAPRPSSKLNGTHRAGRMRYRHCIWSRTGETKDGPAAIT